MKLVLILIALCVGFIGNAQTTMTSQYSLLIDTTVNTTAKRLSAGKTNGYYKVVTVQITGTKISGTVAGTAQVQGSLDGTNWYNVGTAYTMTDVASQVTSVTISEYGHLYLSVLFTPTGTMSNIVSAKVLFRKP